MASRVVLKKLSNGNSILKTELRRTLARSYFKTDSINSHRLDGVSKYKQSYEHLVQSYNKMKPTLIRDELRPFLMQIGHIEVPKTVMTGRTKAYDEEEFEDDQAEHTLRQVQEDEEEKAPTLDQL